MKKLLTSTLIAFVMCVSVGVDVFAAGSSIACKQECKRNSKNKITLDSCMKKCK